MPKHKTNKTAAKRFKVSKKGKLIRNRQGTSHLRRKESSSVHKRKNRLASVASGYVKKITLEI